MTKIESELFIDGAEWGSFDKKTLEGILDIMPRDPNRVTIELQGFTRGNENYELTRFIPEILQLNPEICYTDNGKQTIVEFSSLTRAIIKSIIAQTSKPRDVCLEQERYILFKEAYWDFTPAGTLVLADVILTFTQLMINYSGDIVPSAISEIQSRLTNLGIHQHYAEVKYGEGDITSKK